MELVLNILIVTTFIAIAWQDFTTREISVVLFPLVTVFLVIHSINGPGMKIVTWNFSTNLVFLVVQLLFMFYYLQARYGKNPGLFKNYFGWGDVLILVSVCMTLSLPLFISFIILSSLLSICLVCIHRVFYKEKMQQIPFAGVAAILFVVTWLTGLNHADTFKLFALN